MKNMFKYSKILCTTWVFTTVFSFGCSINNPSSVYENNEGRLSVKTIDTTEKLVAHEKSIRLQKSKDLLPWNDIAHYTPDNPLNPDGYAILHALIHFKIKSADQLVSKANLISNYQSSDPYIISASLTSKKKMKAVWNIGLVLKTQKSNIVAAGDEDLWTVNSFKKDEVIESDSFPNLNYSLYKLAHYLLVGLVSPTEMFKSDKLYNEIALERINPETKDKTEVIGTFSIMRDLDPQAPIYLDQLKWREIAQEAAKTLKLKYYQF